MKFAVANAIVCIIAAAGQHPIENVITMLQGLEAKVKEEAAAEELTYTKFERWCGNSFKTLEKAIAEEKAEIEVLQDQISAKTKQEAVLTEQIGALETEIGELQAAGAAADTLRSKTANAAASAQADYDATITAIESALAAMEGAKDTTDVGLLEARQRVQKALNLAGLSVTEEQRNKLQAFVQEGSVAHVAQPAPAAAPRGVMAAGDYGEHVKEYSFKSDSVIELLKGLLTKFEDEKLAATKAETNSLNAHALSGQARTNAITAAQTSKTEKTTELGTVQGEKMIAGLNLEEVENDLDADSTTLSETQKQCALKQSEWAERTATRKGELEAMAAAIEILAKVAGVRTSAPGNPIPPASPVSFIQISDADPRSRVVQLLRQEAHEVHSHALERLAQEISVHRDSPFAEVNNMIQKMIFRLMSEQKDEDVHKNWCDQELDKSNASKVNKEDKISELTAKIDAQTATAQILTDEIATNADMIQSIESHMAEATEIRKVGKKENEVSMKDAEDAQKALSEAIAVLESFYKESGMVAKESWEFVQRSADLPAEPSTWSAGYTGVADPKNQPDGILTLLKQVSSNFDRMYAETQAQEQSDQAAYEEDMKACEMEKARRLKESDMKEQEKKRLVDKTATMEKTRKQVESELEAVEQYLKDLEPACVTGDSTYEERKAARQQEIDALHEAQGILQNAFAGGPAPAPAAAFLAKTHRH